MDRFDALRAFVQVVESGSLTRAAGALGVATSAISRRIKDLESHLGTQLLQRTTRQLRLTAAGEKFHARAQLILQSMAEAEAEAGDQANALSGPLRLAAPLGFGQSHLAPILLEFSKEHPEVQLDMDFSDRMVDLIAEGHDLALRIGNLADSTLIARKLAEVKLVVCAAPSFWDRHGMPDAPEDLASLPALAYTGSERIDTWRFTAPDGRKGAIETRVVMRATSGSFLCSAAEAGLGVALQPSFICAGAIADRRLVPVLTDHQWPTVTIHLVYPQTRHLSARARALMDFIRDRIGPVPEWEAVLRDT